MTLLNRRLSTAVALVLLVPVRASACAVCGGGNPANRFAFFLMTVVMSLLPLGLFAVAFLWLRSRLRARGVSEFVERDAVSAVPRPALVDTPSRDNGEPLPPPVPAA